MKYESYSPPKVDMITLMIKVPIAQSFHSNERTELLTDDPDDVDL